jgi:hypothetical protein
MLLQQLLLLLHSRYFAALLEAAVLQQLQAQLR